MNPHQKKRLCLAMGVTGGGLLLLLGYALFVCYTGFGLPCAFHLLTGLDCAACGLSRAMASLLQGDFTAALGYNTIWPLYLAYLLWLSLALSIPYIRHGRCRIPRPLCLHFLMAAVVLVYGVWRNF
ncbi:MAG: DUF2752 domain-containing protein [Ruminococcaceae bacterium]|nr:DUF2752 domain-containing protein [Oscillospiraceae bacterium]